MNVPCGNAQKCLGRTLYSLGSGQIHIKNDVKGQSQATKENNRKASKLSVEEL